jgi:hypothetical protein
MKEINKDIVKETSNRLLGLCETIPAAYKCMIELLSSNRRIVPVTVLDRWGCSNITPPQA